MNKLWTGYCQTDPGGYRSHMEGFVAFNEHIPLETVQKMGFKTFIFAHTTKAVKYADGSGRYYGNNNEITVPVSHTVLVFPTESCLKSALKDSGSFKGILVVDRQIRTADGIEKWLCKDCPRAVECLYDSSKKADYSCKPTELIGVGISQEYRISTTNPQSERFEGLIKAMGADPTKIVYKKNIGDYTFKSIGKCDYAGYGGFQLKDIDPCKHIHFDMKKKDNPSAVKSVTTKKFKKERCSQCFFAGTKSTYYSRGAVSMCLRYPSGISSRFTRYCWNTWGRYNSNEEKYKEAYAFMTSADVDRVVAAMMESVLIPDVKKWIHYGSMEIKQGNAMYYAFPEIDQQFGWTSKYLVIRKHRDDKRTSNITVVTETELNTKYKLKDCVFGSPAEVPDKIIPLYLLTMGAIMNCHTNLHNVLDSYLEVHTDSCSNSSSYVPLVKVKCNHHSVTIGLSYYGHTEYQFSTFQDVFTRINPDGTGGYFSQKNTVPPLYFK